MNTTPVAVFWFRRDLRLDDNAGLHAALNGPLPVLPLFIFDRDILDKLADKTDARVSFIHHAIAALQTRLAEFGSSMVVRYGRPEEIWPALLEEFSVGAVYTNRDYEPYAGQRDAVVEGLLAAQGIPLHTFKDHVIFEKNEVLKDDGTPYTVFTPYSKKWLAKLATRQSTDENGGTVSYFFKSYPNHRYFDHFVKIGLQPLPSLAEMGFEPTQIAFPPTTVARKVIMEYADTRNIPGIAGTSRLGVHFRFGTISIREKARAAQPLSAIYLNELIWRDFYSQILGNFPHVAERPFRLQYEKIPWRDASDDFEKWQTGMTGYPIVDAGMRELNATGYMHNRVRMIAASFLTKHLLLDWRLGEAYFAEKLLDFDLASNSGGWQWAAGCGTDAAPYFRIFNPTEQAKKFDPDRTYIKRWVPEIDTLKYPKPVVDHAFARQRCLEVYKKALAE